LNAANKAVIKALWDVLASQKQGRAMWAKPYCANAESQQMLIVETKPIR